MGGYIKHNFQTPHHQLEHGWQVVCASSHWPIYTPAHKPIKACKIRADYRLVVPLYYWHWIRLFICHVDGFYRYQRPFFNIGYYLWARYFNSTMVSSTTCVRIGFVCQISRQTQYNKGS